MDDAKVVEMGTFGLGETPGATWRPQPTRGFFMSSPPDGFQLSVYACCGRIPTFERER
jgi:hypothetical protein